MIHIPAIILILLSFVFMFTNGSKIHSELEGYANICNAIHGVMFVMLAALYEWFIFH